MADYFEMEIAGLKRKLPICKLNEKISIAGFLMFSDAELTVVAAKALLDKIDFDFDIILTAEAKGIPLAHELSRQSGKNYVVARKAKKVYMRNPIEVEVKSITTSFIQRLYLDQADVDLLKSGKILIADDVISTGASLNALETLVAEFDGDIAGICAVLAEGEAANRKDITFLEKLPLLDTKTGLPIDD